jgi:hypothetical protein
MSTVKPAPDEWRIPTPFQDQSGGRVTVPVRRPTFQSLALVVVFLHLADEFVARNRFENAALAASLTYALCVVLAWLSTASLRLVRTGDKLGRWSVAAVGGVGLGVSATTPFTTMDMARFAAVGVVLAASVICEAGYRVATKRTGAPARDTQVPSGPVGHAVTARAEIHAARSTLVDATLALDRAVKRGESITDENVRILRAEASGLAEQAEVFGALLDRLHTRRHTRRGAEASTASGRRRRLGAQRAGRGRPTSSGSRPSGE